MSLAGNNPLNHMQILQEHRKFSEETGISFPTYSDLTQDQYDSNRIKRMTSIPEETQSQSRRTYSEINTSPQRDAYSTKELLVMTIEIGNGNHDTIHVSENDDPADLAKDFCMKHGLSPNIVVPLAQNIYHNIEQVFKDREISSQQEGPIVHDDNKNSEDFNFQALENNFLQNSHENHYNTLENEFVKNSSTALDHKQIFSTEPATYEKVSLSLPYFMQNTEDNSRHSVRPNSLAKTKSVKNLNISYEGRSNIQAAKFNQSKRSTTPEFMSKKINPVSTKLNKGFLVNNPLGEGEGKI